MKKLKVSDIVKAASKDKPINVNQIKSFADKEYPEEGIRIKDINNYLYGEYYNNVPYGSCEAFEKIIK